MEKRGKKKPGEQLETWQQCRRKKGKY